MQRRHGAMFLLLFVGSVLVPHAIAQATYRFDSFRAHPPIHVFRTTGKVPKGMTPDLIRSIYQLPKDGGTGTIAIIGAYDDVTAEADLAAFDAAFGLPACTRKNDCFEQHLIASKTAQNSGWALETALDVEWAHAIAPRAKILLVEAQTPSGKNLLAAIDYAARRADARAISMSWGGAEFPDETSLDTHFSSVAGAPFFASSGDNGTGASWPAASPDVIGVGGTTIALKDGVFSAETAWRGSGGGISEYEKVPEFQKDAAISRAHGMRAIPDVAYDADPASGFPIVHKGVWRTVGGTSAGAPQWAAIATLGGTVTAGRLYTDKASQDSAKYFRDIKSGENGDCGYVCTAHVAWHYITGLGSPQSGKF